MLGFFKSLLGQGRDEDLRSAIESGAFLLDVRSAEEFAYGSVEGAVNIPLDQLLSRLKKIQGQKTIVVFCRSGARASQAKNLLESKGFVQVINGGSWSHVDQIKRSL